MESITDIVTAGACDVCGGCTDGLQALVVRAGDSVCGQCDAVFTAARTLLDNNVNDEPTILGTLAYAWTGDALTKDPEDYGGLELISSVDGVPLLRPPRITADVITYVDSHIPRAAKIAVFSREVKPRELAEVYERLLNEYGIHTDQCSGTTVA